MKDETYVHKIQSLAWILRYKVSQYHLTILEETYKSKFSHSLLNIFSVKWHIGDYIVWSCFTGVYHHKNINYWQIPPKCLQYNSYFQPWICEHSLFQWPQTLAPLSGQLGTNLPGCPGIPSIDRQEEWSFFF